MQIKQLISQLQELYATYDDEYKSVMGEPEVMIDIFRLPRNHDPSKYLRQYAGFSGKIVINKSPDGVYDILSAFDEDQNQTEKAKELSSNPWPFPQSGKHKISARKAKRNEL